MSAEKVSSMMIECSIKGNSGWVLGDVEADPSLKFTGQKRTSPGRMTIPNTGFMTEIVKETVNGKTVEAKKNVRIRYIKNCPYIKPEEQEKHGYAPHKDKEQDTIAIYEGSSILTREGDTGLYDYIANVNYNGTSPTRSNKAGILYFVVDLDKRREVVNEFNFTESRAVGIVEKLVIKKVSKTGTSYDYNEIKIDGLCKLMHVWGDTYAERIQALTFKAQENPEGFLKKATAFEETTVTDVTHALTLNVIKIEGGSVIACETKKVLATLDPKLKAEEKITAFADLLRTNEYHETYNLLKALVDAAKEHELA